VQTSFQIDSGVSGTLFGGSIFAAFILASNDHIGVSSSSDLGTTWTTPVDTGFSTRPGGNLQRTAPAIIAFNDILVLAWADDTTSYLSFSTSSDGSTWSTETSPPGTHTPQGTPSLALFDYSDGVPGSVIAVFTDDVTSIEVYTTTSTDGVTWSTPAVVSGTETPYPGAAIAYFNGELYLLYSLSSDVDLITSTDGVTWSSPYSTGLAQAYYLTIVAFDGRLIFTEGNGVGGGYGEFAISAYGGVSFYPVPAQSISPIDRPVVGLVAVPGCP